MAAAAANGSLHIVTLLLRRGAENAVMDNKYGTALAAAVFERKNDMVSQLVGLGLNVDTVAGEFGTALGQAIYQGSTEIVSILLEHGADVLRVGGSYPTSSGVYPSALDVAHSEGSNASPFLIGELEAAQNRRTNPPGADPVNDVITRPPFPMPCTRPCSTLCASHHKVHTNSPPPSSLWSELRTGGNITPEQADIRFQELDKDVLWRSLATLVSLSQDTRAKCQWIQNDLRYFVACNFDFGLAYAATRVGWKCFNDDSVDARVISIQRYQWHKNARALDEARAKTIRIDHSSSGQVQQELINSPYSIMPRRLWDLKSNRVVDFQMLHATQVTSKTTPTFWAVSHSWTGDMPSVWTTINQHQWPVPLPRDINLESLRSELVTLGAEYVWIDVLCLRQKSDIDNLERLRKEEWKLDVPTIGNVYRAAAKIVRYFNGLGVGFRNDGWDNEKHWLQRAWTLQEIKSENTTINGGIPRDRGTVFLNARGEVLGKVTKLRSVLRPVIQLATQVDSEHGCEVYDLAREMTRRFATNKVDKLSGLFYLLRTTKLPCYDENKDSEDIWRQCFHLLPPNQKAEILLNFPYRASDKQWFPTWAQILGWPVRDPECDHIRSQSLLALKKISGESSFFIRNIWTIPGVFITEIEAPDSFAPDASVGGSDIIPVEYEVKINNWLFGFYMPYLSQKPIEIQDDHVFTLATADVGHDHNWVVCKAIDRSQWVGTDIDPGVAEFKVLKKVGVIRTDACSEILEHSVSLLQQTDCLFI